MAQQPPPPHILLIGAHGKVAQHLLPLLLSTPYNVTALIRSSSQEASIQALAPTSEPSGALTILVHDLSTVRTPQDALAVLARAPDTTYIIFAAGSGGKAGDAGTYAIDRDAALAFAHAATHCPRITRYLTISAFIARRAPARWWTAETKATVADIVQQMPAYAAAKLAADECLTAWSLARQATDRGFKFIILRPGTLTDAPATGTVRLGAVKEYGAISRADVARAALAMLGSGMSGWFDVVGGPDLVSMAVKKLDWTGEESGLGEDRGGMREVAEGVERGWGADAGAGGGGA